MLQNANLISYDAYCNLYNLNQRNAHFLNYILIFNFLMSSVRVSNPGSSSSGRRFYIDLWYACFIFEHTILPTRLLILKHVLYQNCIQIRLPEDEPSASKHVEDKKLKIEILILEICNSFVYIL